MYSNNIEPKHTKETLRTYRDNSLEYASKFDGAFKYHEVSLEKFLAKLKPESSVVDVACGVGTYAIKICNAGHYVLCVDNSPEMLAIASSRKLHTSLLNIETQKLGTNMYDAAWIMTGITHIPKGQRLNNVLENVNNSIKKDGILFIGVHEGTDNTLKEDIPGTGYFRHMSKFMPRELEEITSKKFTLDSHWETFGYGGVKFLNYLFRK